MAVLDINGRGLKVKIDTGASCNVMSKQAYDVLNARQPTGIRLCKTKLESYGGHRLTVQRKASLTAEYKRKYSPVDFVIVRGNAPTILGLQSSVELKLIYRIDGVTTAGKLVDDYRDVFCGLGCLNGEHHIQLRGDAKPVVHSARRVPFRLQSQFKAQLEEMEENQLITKVTEPTEWVNPLVTVMKSDKPLRICLDPGSLNAAIKREHCYTDS